MKLFNRFQTSHVCNMETLKNMISHDILFIFIYLYSLYFLFSENELLWREISDLRDQHKNQQDIINKVKTKFIGFISLFL